MRTELRKLPSNVKLLFGGQCGSGGLLAVTESGVEDANVVGVGDPVGDIFPPLTSRGEKV